MNLSAIVSIRWLALLSLFFSSACIGESIKQSQFEEFEHPQDEFEFTVLSADRALLEAWFQDVRKDLFPFTLVLPPSVSVNWKWVSVSGQLARSSEPPLELEPDVLPLPDDFVKESRTFLADIPLAHYSFPSVSNLKTSGPGQQGRWDIRSATFELTFSDSVLDSHRNRGQAHSESKGDAYQRMARVWVKNPSHIEAFRGHARETEAPARNDSGPGYEVSSGPVSSKSSLRFRTKGSGVLALDANQASEMGFDTAAAPASHLTLVHRGEILSLGFEGDGDESWEEGERIWFPYFPLESDQTEWNAYFLVWGKDAGPRIEQRGDYPAAGDSSPHREPVLWDLSLRRFEVDAPEFHRHVGDVGGIEVYWRPLGVDPTRIEFDLMDLDPSAFQGASPTAPLHIRLGLNRGGDTAINVRFNDLALTPSEDITVDGLFRTAIPKDVLRTRGNRIEIALDSSLEKPSRSQPEIYLDWVKLWVPAKPDLRQPVHESSNPPLEWRAKEGGGPVVLWSTDSTEETRRVVFHENGEGQSVYDLRLAPEKNAFVGPSSLHPRDWSVFDPNEGLNENVQVELVQGPEILGSTSQADLLVVAPEMFKPHLEEYLTELRRPEGWTWFVTDPETIYDEFSHGIKDLRAIRSFCQYAFRRFQSPPPRYLWLVGESRWDPKDLLGSGVVDQVPSPPLANDSGMGSNDQWYAYISGTDSLPDLMVSRLSVSTTDELLNYLEKAQVYEKEKNHGWWRVRCLELADDGYGSLADINLKNGLERHYLPEVIKMEWYPQDVIRRFEARNKIVKEGRGVRPDVVQAWNKGAALIEYIGHGGITVWSKQAMFLGLNRPDSDILKLANAGRYPLVFIRACLSAAINWPTYPGHISVSEALIAAPQRGAVAVLGPAGTEFQREQELYGRHFHSAYWNHGIDRLSEARVYAHCSTVLREVGSDTLTDQFILHGDPLLNLEFPEVIQISHIERDDIEEYPSVRTRFRCPFAGTMQMRVLWRNEVVHESPRVEVTQRDFEHVWKLPQGLSLKKNLRAGFYLWNEKLDRDAYGSIPVPESKQMEPKHLEMVSSEPGPLPAPIISFQSGTLLPSRPATAEVLFRPPAGATQTIVARSTLLLNGKVQSAFLLRLRPSESQTVQATLVPQGVGKALVKLVLETLEKEQNGDQFEFTGEIEVFAPGKITLEEVSVSPDDPVLGESVEISATIRSGRNSYNQLLSPQFSLRVPKALNLRVREADFEPQNFPVWLTPGETRQFRWIVENLDVIGSHQGEAIFTTETQTLAIPISFRMGAPPTIDVQSIEAADRIAAHAVGESIPFEIRIKNPGDAPTDRVILEGREQETDIRFEVEVPEIPPKETVALPFEATAHGHHFTWLTSVNLLPTAMSSRTKWNIQKIQCGVNRAVEVSMNQDQIEWKGRFETREALRSFHHRYWELGDTGFRLTNESRVRDYSPGFLKVFDPSAARSATQPALAALENPELWWIGNDRIQIHPESSHSRLRMMLPWTGESVVAKIGPKYEKNPGYLGFAMPAFRIVNPRISFDLSPVNTNYNFFFPPKVVEIHEPGLEFFLENRRGGWPGFGGMMFLGLPEIRTPVMVLPQGGEWSARMDFEWIGADCAEKVFQARVRSKSGGWSAWLPFQETDAPLEGDQFILRCWFDPGEDCGDLFIRSVSVSFRRSE